MESGFLWSGGKIVMGTVHVGAWAAAFDNNDSLWFSDYISGGLCKYSCVLKKMDYIDDLDLKPYDKESMHRSMMIKNDMILLCPFERPWIQLYDIKTQVSKKLEIPHGKDATEYFMGEAGNNVYLFSNSNDGNIYLIDFINQRIIKDDYCTQEIDGIRKQFKSTYILY